MELPLSSADEQLQQADVKKTSSAASLDSLNSDDDDDFVIPVPPSPDIKKYLYPKKEFVDNLRPEDVRWFYKGDGEKQWRPFIGYDSLRIECRYRAAALENNDGVDINEKILVRGGLYDVDVSAKSCSPIYWTGVYFSLHTLSVVGQMGGGGKVAAKPKARVSQIIQNILPAY